MPRKSTETVEAPVVTDADASAESTEETSTTEAPVVEAPDISDFVAAASAAVATQDYDAVTAAYVALDRKGKSAATKHISEVVKSYMTAKDAVNAFAWMDITDALNKVKATKPKSDKQEKAPVDPSGVHVEKLTGLYLAYQLAADNAPAGIPEDFDVRAAVKDAVTAARTQADAVLAWRANEDEAKGDAPEHSDTVARSIRLAFQGSGSKRKASGESGPGYSGPQRSISAHIAEAFADQPSGTFLTVSDLRNFESTQYGNDHPSAGAISSALNSPKFAVEGVTPGKGGAKGVFGASKA